MWHFLGKIPKVVVSGLSIQNVNLKPNGSENVYVKSTVFNKASEKLYHRPNLYVSVEKKKLSKETKKAKLIH